MVLGLPYNHPRPRWEFALYLSTSSARRSPPDGNSSCSIPPRGKQAKDLPEWKINPCLSNRAPPPGWETSLALKELRQAEDPALKNATTSYTLLSGF